MFDRINDQEETTEIDKLVTAYMLMMQMAVSFSEHEIEQAVLLGDEDTAFKERTKLIAIQVTKKLFDQCCQEIEQTQKSFWHDRFML